jgi:hypothetical protein
MVYGRGASVNCKERNMSSSVYCSAGNVSQTSRRENELRETNLVVTRTKDELGIGIHVNNALDDLAFVDRDRADLKVLLTDQDYEAVQQL